jgi:hypothetical protein
MAMVFLLAQRNQVGLFLGLNALVPLLALMLVAVFTYTANRYAFVTLMSWLTLTSAAVVELVRQSKGIMKILAVGVLLVLLAEPVGENLMYYKYQNGNRDDWRGAAQVVQQRYQPGDIVVGTENSVVAAYYLGPEVRVRWLSNQNVEALAKSATRVWFLLDMTTFAYDPRLVNWIYANTELVANLDVHYRARNFEMRVRLFDPARCRQ